MDEGITAAWNMQGSLIEELSRLLYQGTQCYISGRLDKWFYCLKAAKMRAINVLTEKERSDLATLEADVSLSIYLINKDINNFPNKVQEILIEKRKTVVGQLEKYSELLSDALGAHGLLINAKENTRSF